MPDDEKIDLLDNAVAAIQMGVADYEAPDEQRVLSALRNLYARVLLLLKEKLVRESPPDSDDSLIYIDLVPTRAGAGIVWKPSRKNRTVDFHQIKERFEGLGLTLDWKRLETLRGLRNAAEHHTPK